MHDDPRPPLEPVAPEAADAPPPLPLPAPAPLRTPAEGRSRLALVAFVALLAGVAGGFAGGRISERAESTTASGEAGASADGDAGSSAAIRSGGTTGTDATPTATRLFKRAVPGGELRVWRIENASRCDGNGCPPPTCIADASFHAVVVADWEISVGGGPAWAEFDGPVATAAIIMTSAPASGAPSNLGFLFRTSAAVRSVRWVAENGAVRDQMEPRDGIAGVVASGTLDFDRGPLLRDGSRIEAVDAAGRVLTTLFLDDPSWMTYGSPPPSCTSGPSPIPQPSPVPTLPAAGEQPADRAAAEAAVRATFAVALGNPADPAAANAAIDDPEGLQAARDASNRQFPQYAGKVRFEMTGLVFVSPTRAAFTYTVTETDKGQVLANQVGNARLVEGRWLITRATVCNLLPVKPAGSC